MLELIAKRRRTRSRSISAGAALGGVGCLACVGVGLALAASGDFDRSFSEDGIAKTGFGPGGHGAGFANAVAVQPNDRIVIAGATKSGDFGLARFRSNGKLDRSFGDNGTVRVHLGESSGAEDVAVRRDGGIVVVGDVVVGGRIVIAVARLRPSGELDPSFGTGGKSIVDPFDPSTETWRELNLALGCSGEIVIGGTGSVSGPVNSPGFVVRLEPDGDLDPSFADGGLKTIDLAPGTMGSGSTSVYQVIPDRRGRIAAAVTADVVSEDDAPYVRAWMVRLRSNGDYDPSFSGDGRKRVLGRYSTLFSVAAAPHGRLAAAGRAGDGILVTRVKDSGAFDRSFAGDGVKTTKLGIRGSNVGAVGALDVMVQRNGKPLVAGVFQLNFTRGAAVVARFRPNGDLDQSFSGDGKKVYRRLSREHPAFWDAGMQDNGKILLSGDTGGSPPKAYVARLRNRGRPFLAP